MSKLKRLAADRSGNFGMMTAVLLPVLVGVAGLAMDVTNAMQVKSDLQGVADAASLAAASAMAQRGYTKAQAEALARDYFVAQVMAEGPSNAAASEKAAMEQLIRDATKATATTKTSGSSEVYTVELDSLYALELNPLTGVIAGRTMDIGITATASTGADGAGSAGGNRTGISMYLALDRSGSMSFVTSSSKGKGTSCVNYTEENWGKNVAPSSPCYIRKIEALKTASTMLFEQLKKADPSVGPSTPTSTLVRTGASSYTHDTQKETPMAWGTAAASGYVQNLPDLPEGGTDANGAMQNALNALKTNKNKSDTESKEHGLKDNGTIKRFIVLMTDGQMTGYSAEWNASLDKSVRQKCDQAKKDGISIFSVAFMAPQKGKSLLRYCATSSDYYYSPEDMASLVTAFGEIADKAAKQTVRLTN
jgi:Flp pilus assembly protein TadG